MTLQLHVEAAKNFNRKAEELFQKIVFDPHTRTKSSPAGGFQPDIVRHEIPAADVIALTRNGYVAGPLQKEVAKTFPFKDSVLGLFAEDYKGLVRLAESMQKTATLRDKVSVRFLIDSIFNWIATSYQGADVIPMTDIVLAEAEHAIQEIELWLPIAMLHIETDIVLGKITLKTITKEVLDDYHAASIDQIRKDGHDIGPELQQHFRTERQELQGLAAATIKVHAEPIRAGEIAVDEAESALAILRLYSLANLEPELTTYCTLLGRERIDETRTFTVQDGKIRGFSRALLSAADPSWTLDNATVAEFRRTHGLDFLGSLLIKQDRTEYEQALIDCLLLYSKGSLAKDPVSKLVAVLVALESMLLKDGGEPIQQNLSERIAFLFAPERRIEIKRSVIRAYGLRSQFIHHGHSVGSDEIEALREFLINVWAAVHGLINLSSRCSSKAQFFKLFEEVKMSGGDLFSQSTNIGA
ncbi:MAG: hypothetical protein QOH71_2472 [Blastocatellia bacterium]|jgi:hypothetical protein|nr:hypothetical protein [Blastocatellia bacterium]